MVERSTSRQSKRHPARAAFCAAWFCCVAAAWFAPVSAKPAADRPRSDLAFAPEELRQCTTKSGGYVGPKPADNANVAQLAQLLHGTWLRRLWIAGAPVETNSLWHFDLAPTGRGTALLIDRVDQGWDSHAVQSGTIPSGSEKHPATTGGFWQVRLTRATADPAGRGRQGIRMIMDGQYRGSDLPRAGFTFREYGTLFATKQGFATQHPWHAPPMADASAQIFGESFTPVDGVILKRGGNTSPPSLTYVMCREGIVDRYYKISDSPTPKGVRSLAEAWQSALASIPFEPQQRQ